MSSPSTSLPVRPAVLPEDAIDLFSGADRDPELAALRASRQTVRRAAQGAFEALFAPAQRKDFAPSERCVVAGFVAALVGAEVEADWYLGWASELGAAPEVVAAMAKLGRQAAHPGPYGVHVEDGLRAEAEPGPDLPELGELGQLLGPRLVAMLAYAHTVALHPRDGRSERLQPLLDAGLSTTQVSVLTQLICMLSFQLRVAHGLRVIGGGGAA